MLWLRISGEMLAEDFRIIGLPKREYKEFLMAEERFFQVYRRLLHVVTFNVFVLLDIQLFFMKVIICQLEEF